jgi:hypothetical protein
VKPKQQPWSPASGKPTDRVASILPEELHRAIADSAVAALRTGIPLQLLDGHVASGPFLPGRGRHRRRDRAKHLDEQIAELERTIRNARRNANATDDDEVAQGFLSDAEDAQTRLRKARLARAELDVEADGGAVPTTFESGADYLAHALARLACCEKKGSPELNEPISRVLEFTSIDTSEPGWATFGFKLLIPADGRVARLGPIYARVANCAYRNTLRKNVELDEGHRLLFDLATAHGLTERLQHTSADRVLEEVRVELITHGYSPLAAGILLRSGLEPIYRVIGHELWNEPLPADLDPAYATHLVRIYRSPDFAWTVREHSIDCSTRQALIDIVWNLGATANLGEIEEALEGTSLTRQRVTVLARPQQLGDAPVWHSCLRRTGNWAPRAPITKKILHVVDCPHCGGHARHAVRTPETPGGLLCPDCRRSPDTDSPVFPPVYLATSREPPTK